MTNLEAVVLRYVQNHPLTRHSTVVEAIGDRDWHTQKRVRQALDFLTTIGLLIRTGATKREYRYTVKGIENGNQN
jgi:hypothetical protein